MTDIYLLRHGHAEADAPRDDLRPLSARGEKQVQEVVEHAKCALGEVQACFASPYIRAQQTAELVKPVLQDVDWLTWDTITPSGHPQNVIEDLYKYQKRSAVDSILLVTHNPFVNMLLDKLGGFDVGLYRMGTATLAKLSCDVIAADCAHLEWIKHASY